MGSKLAICVPTYNRPDVIQELMAKGLSIFQEYEIDIYIYDSSEGTETEKIVEENKNIYSNLSYIRVDSSVHSNMKVYNIYRHYQHVALYKYIWICADYIRWSEAVIKAVCENLDKEYDMLIVNHHDVENIGTREYDDKNELFVDCAWHMTLYGATIIKIETVLKDVDWEYMITRYTIPERINFSHVALYFEQLLRMGSFKAFYMSVEADQLIGTTLRQRSGWHDRTFFVWCTCWPSAINALPDDYQNKNAVIKKGNVNSDILILRNIISLREANIYSLKVYRQYKGMWKNLVDVNRIILFLIALMPRRFFSSYNSFLLFIKRTKHHRKYAKYCRKVKKVIKKCHRFRDVYIYGCGQKGIYFADWFDKMGLNYKGFLVSKLQDEDNTCKEHTVQEYSVDILNERNVAILLALSKTNTEEVLLNNPELRGSRQVFTTDIKV